MGGAVALLLHKKDPTFWNGAVLVAPMCKVKHTLYISVVLDQLGSPKLIALFHPTLLDIGESKAASTGCECIDQSGGDYTEMEDCTHQRRH